MNGFALPNNYIEDPQRLLRRRKFANTRDIFESPSRTPSTKTQSLRKQALTPEGVESWNLAPAFEAMAEKTPHEFSAPTTANIRTGPNINIGDNGFALKPAVDSS